MIIIQLAYYTTIIFLHKRTWVWHGHMPNPDNRCAEHVSYALYVVWWYALPRTILHMNMWPHAVCCLFFFEHSLTHAWSVLNTLSTSDIAGSGNYTLSVHKVHIHMLYILYNNIGVYLSSEHAIASHAHVIKDYISVTLTRYWLSYGWNHHVWPLANDI